MDRNHLRPPAPTVVPRSVFESLWYDYIKLLRTFSENDSYPPSFSHELRQNRVPYTAPSLPDHTSVRMPTPVAQRGEGGLGTYARLYSDTSRSGNPSGRQATGLPPSPRHLPMRPP